MKVKKKDLLKRIESLELSLHGGPNDPSLASRIVALEEENKVLRAVNKEAVEKWKTENDIPF